MPFVKAGPNQYLLIGRGGNLESRGSAVQVWLRPGTIHVLVPTGKQEATFEFTQETRDGIPLRFKGIVLYRVTDPVAAARLFDFAGGGGIAQVTTLLTHVVLGELRHAVSHMTMTECIEQRKTTLTGVVEAAVDRTINDGTGGAWGITVEVAQVAQVFIVDAQLRQQLEAEVRNEIRLAADQSNLRAQEELEQAQVARERRRQAEQLVTERQALQLRQERVRAEAEAEQDRLATQTPVRLNEVEREVEVLRGELELRRLQAEVAALDVERELAMPRARQALRREILPLEQGPRIVEAASRVFQGTNLSLYGEGGRLVGELAPVLEVLGGAVRRAVAAGVAGAGGGPGSGAGSSPEDRPARPGAAGGATRSASEAG